MRYPSLTEHFEMILSSLQGELWGEAMATTATFKMRLADLENQLKQKDEKLSELTHGIPIEKAKEGGDYYCLDLGYCVATYFENGQWYYSDDGPNRNPCEVSNRLYPLPSTDTKEDN